jgi:hypothetical protein
MTTQAEIPNLKSLEYFPYLDDNGSINEDLPGKIGVYAIFDQDKILQYVGYSRDIYLSLKQHLVRQPQKCYWLKYQIITRPNRTILEETRQAWIQENGSTPPGNDQEESQWIHAIDAKLTMSKSEQEDYHKTDELGQMKLLKKIARRVQAEIEEKLKNRGANVEIRFNPKLKEQGLLDLK